MSDTQEFIHNEWMDLDTPVCVDDCDYLNTVVDDGVMRTIVDDWGGYGGRMDIHTTTCKCGHTFDWCKHRPKRCPMCGTEIWWGMDAVRP